MRLIVGLGNPGAKYRDTPHNAGFWVCERLAQRHALAPETTRFSSLLQRGRILGHEVALLRPQTFMNLSGQAVAEALRYLPVEGSLLVVFDDMDLPAGRLRIRLGGGHGGHNGMRSIIESIGREDFPRVRLGVGRPRTGGTNPRTTAGHLLARLPEAERKRFDEITDRAADAVEVLLERGVQAAMNAFNALPGLDEAKPGNPS
jgi:PTH1 family peptidyl-tRNA hydrolase